MQKWERSAGSVSTAAPYHISWSQSSQQPTRAVSSPLLLRRSLSLPPFLPPSSLPLPRQIGSLARTTCDGDGRVTEGGGWLQLAAPLSPPPQFVSRKSGGLFHPNCRSKSLFSPPWLWLKPEVWEAASSQHWSETSCTSGWVSEHVCFVVSVRFGGIL